MAEASFHSLSSTDRRDALEVAEGLSGRRAYLLEKDIWVVSALRALFDAPFRDDLVFKGGTSLSKAWHAIRRFSKISISPTTSGPWPRFGRRHGRGGAPFDAQPGAPLDAIDPGAPRTWVHEWVVPAMEDGLAQAGLSARVRSGQRTGADRLCLPVRRRRPCPSGSDGGVRRAFDRRAPCSPAGDMRCGAVPAGSRVSDGPPDGHARPAHLLGESYGRACFLPSAAVPGRTPFPALARFGAPGRCRLRGNGVSRPCSGARCCSSQGDVLPGERRRRQPDRLRDSGFGRSATGPHGNRAGRAG